MGGTHEHNVKKRNRTYMEKKKSMRTVKVTNEVKKQLSVLFGCTERMVYKALCFETESDLARKIRYVALKEKGGWIEAAVPESDIFYDTTENGRHYMRQYFGNGAVLEFNLDTGGGTLLFKGKPVMSNERVLVSEIPELQHKAMSM